MKPFVASARIVDYVDVFFQAENDLEAIEYSKTIEYAYYPVLDSRTEIIEVRRDGWGADYPIDRPLEK